MTRIEHTFPQQLSSLPLAIFDNVEIISRRVFETLCCCCCCCVGDWLLLAFAACLLCAACSVLVEARLQRQGGQRPRPSLLITARYACLHGEAEPRSLSHSSYFLQAKALKTMAAQAEQHKHCNFIFVSSLRQVGTLCFSCHIVQNDACL